MINNRGDYPALLRNDGGNANHWLEVLLIGTKSNRDGIGASLKLTSEGVVQVEQAKGGMSYMSASDPRIHFGLGKRTKIDSLEITWPSGQVDKLTNVPIDQIIAIKEGAGIVPHVPFPKVAARVNSWDSSLLDRTLCCDIMKQIYDLMSSARISSALPCHLGSTLLDALTTPLWSWKTLGSAPGSTTTTAASSPVAVR